MVLKWNVAEGALSNKNQTLPEITPIQAIPSPPTALHAHSTPIPFIDKISVLFEPLTEQDASSQNPSLSRQGRPRGYATLFFPNIHRLFGCEPEKQLGHVVPLPATKRLHPLIAVSGDEPDCSSITMAQNKRSHAVPVLAIAVR